MTLGPSKKGREPSPLLPDYLCMDSKLADPSSHTEALADALLAVRCQLGAAPHASIALDQVFDNSRVGSMPASSP